jgi:hypothetical protein
MTVLCAWELASTERGEFNGDFGGEFVKVITPRQCLALDQRHEFTLLPARPTCGKMCDMKLIQRMFNMDSS